MMKQLTTFVSIYMASSLWLSGAQAQTQATSNPASAKPAAANCPALLRYEFPRLQDEAPQSLCQFAGKVVLVVNTASYCAFTTQYQGLEDMYARYKDQGLVIVGFPSNNFGQQEPGTSKQIADFCYNTYGVKFPMMAKTDVVGAKRNPFYVALDKTTHSAPKWNFHKYLIERDGQTVRSFLSMVGPDSPLLTDAVEQALKRTTR